jgi:hypothetical protein
VIFVFVLVLIALYFAPTFVALTRNGPHTLLAVTISLALGWTVIGWIVGMILAVSGRTSTLATPPAFPQRPGPPPAPPGAQPPAREW